MKRAILAALAALLLIASPVAGVVTYSENKAPTIVGVEAWGASIAYDFNDRHGQLLAHHRCQEVYAFNADGSILHGPILQVADLAPGESVTLDAWPSSSWGMCVVNLAKDGDGTPNTDLVFLVPPAP